MVVRNASGLHQKKDCQGTSVISVKKNIFSNTILDILIIYKSHSMSLQQISQKMRYTNTLYQGILILIF